MRWGFESLLLQIAQSQNAATLYSPGRDRVVCSKKLQNYRLWIVFNPLERCLYRGFFDRRLVRINERLSYACWARMREVS